MNWAVKLKGHIALERKKSKEEETVSTIVQCHLFGQAAGN